MGDCVSVPSKDLTTLVLTMKQLFKPMASLQKSYMHGRVTNVIRGNSSFVVRWDVEKDETTMSLTKVTYDTGD